jgi:hypothetical protein
LPRAYLTRSVPPSGFGYPLGGFLPPGPRRPYFMPTALLGFRPSEHSLPERYPRRSRRGCTRLPSLRLLVPRTNPRAGPASRGSRALTLPRVPRSTDAVNASRTGYSPGLWPLQGHPPNTLFALPHELLPRASELAAALTASPRHPGVSIGARLARSRSPGPAKLRDRTALLRFPHLFEPAVRVRDNPGYGFTSQTVRHHCRFPAAPWIASEPCRSRRV